MLMGFGFLISLLSANLTPKLLKASGAIVVILGTVMLNRGLAVAGSGTDFNTLVALVSQKLSPTPAEPEYCATEQIIKMTATFTGGLLYSQRWKDFWLHTSALYTVNAENDDDFKFGDVATVGLALHYTPNYDLMVGVEADASYIEKNEDQGFKIGNSCGTVTNLAFVSDWRFLNAFGGNFKLRTSVGLPIYEDLNSKHVVVSPVNRFDQVQLGGGFFGNVAIQWTFRAAPDY